MFYFLENEHGTSGNVPTWGSCFRQGQRYALPLTLKANPNPLKDIPNPKSTLKDIHFGRLVSIVFDSKNVEKKKTKK